MNPNSNNSKKERAAVDAHNIRTIREIMGSALRRLDGMYVAIPAAMAYGMYPQVAGRPLDTDGLIERIANYCDCQLN